MKTKLTVALLGFFTLTAPLFADTLQTINDLIPRLAAEIIENRYAPQIELQTLAAKAARPGAEAERLELAKILAAKAADASVPQPARVWIVRQLELIGGAESVSALTGLLTAADAELRDCARRALEKNPAPAATKSLRNALKQSTEPNWKSGLIHSLGERADTRSVSLIAPSLRERELSSVAAAALGKIATPAARTQLWSLFEENQRDAADGLIGAADRLAAQGDAKNAAAIYSRLYTTAGPWRAAALTGLATTKPREAKTLIPAALSASDTRLQTAALAAAFTVYGQDASRTLAALLPQLKPSAKAVVIGALDASAEPQVLAALNDADETVRLAALETLGRIGSGASVPALLKTAAKDSGSEKKAAAAALTTISGPGADAAILKVALEGEPPVRATAINALGARNDEACVPTLIQYASDNNAAVSEAACEALAKIATDREIDALARLVLAGKAPGANAALQAVVSRTSSKIGTQARLAAIARSATPQQARALFEVLTILGGSEALEIVKQHASSNDEQVKDSAIRALANWPDFEAVKPLQAIAEDANAKRVYNVLAIQGIARLVTASENEPATARVDAAVAAMKAAKRDEEKRLALSALASVPNAKAAQAIQSLLSDSSLQKEAALAGITLAETLVDSEKTAAKDLASAIKAANVSAEISQKAEAILNR